MVEQVDWLLFKLLVLGGLSDNYGNFWKIVKKQICVVECTLPKLYNYENDVQKSVSMVYMYVTALCITFIKEQKQLPSVYTFLSLFPQTTCASPKEALAIYQSEEKSRSLYDM